MYKISCKGLGRLCLAILLVCVSACTDGHYDSADNLGQTTAGEATAGEATAGVTTGGNSPIGQLTGGQLTGGQLTGGEVTDGQGTDGTYSNSFPLADGSAVFSAQSALYMLNEDTSVAGNLTVNPLANVNYRLVSAPEFGDLSLTPDGRFTYTPSIDFYGSDQLVFYAHDDKAGSALATIDFEIIPVQDAPVVEADPPTFIEQGRRYLMRLHATDADADKLTFSAVNLPTWLSLNSSTGVLRGYPAQTEVGVYSNITLSVVDSTGIRTSLEPFSIEVVDINGLPMETVTGIPERLNAGEQVSVDLSGINPNGGNISVSTDMDELLTIAIDSSTLTITASDVDKVSTAQLVSIVGDEASDEERQTYPIVIYPVTASGKGRTLRGRQHGNGVHLVILGDGFTASELPALEDHAFDLIGLMLDDPSIAAHINAWNIHLVLLASNDTGIDDIYSQDTRSTAFNAGYFCQGVERLICADQVQVFAEALSEYPDLDQVVLLVNDRRYGGSGGSVAIASAFSGDIALHEMGHSIAGLADEYVDGSISSQTAFVEGQYANVSTSNDPRAVPWSHWIDNFIEYPTVPGESGVGIFQGAYYHPIDYFRPVSASRMRFNSRDFGAVNGEQWALSVYQRTNPVELFGPALTVLHLNAGSVQRFFVKPVFDTTVQSIDWYLDGEYLIESNDKEDLTLEFARGIHTVEVRVDDISGVIRRDVSGTSGFGWEWEVLAE